MSSIQNTGTSMLPQTQDDEAMASFAINMVDPFERKVPVNEIKMKVLVADTNSLLKRVRLDNYAERIVTVTGVIDEVRDAASRNYLRTTPFQLEFREPSAESIKAVADFSKKTGDYQALSVVDMRVLALTWMMEKEVNGNTDHIRTEPLKAGAKIKGGKSTVNNRAVNAVTTGIQTTPSSKQPSEGPPTSIKKDTETPEVASALENSSKYFTTTTSTTKNAPSAQVLEKEATESTEPTANEGSTKEEDAGDSKSVIGTQTDAVDAPAPKKKSSTRAAKRRRNKERNAVNNTATSTYTPKNATAAPPVSEKKITGFAGKAAKGGKNATATERAGVAPADDDGWITPTNFHKAAAGSDLNATKSAGEENKVGCMTTDYAMQNVLLQMNMSVISVDGMVIKRAKSFVLRCHACFKVTSQMDKQFCSDCGNATLVKMSASVDKKGVTHYHTSRTKKISLRGSVYSIAAPKGGRHANNLILREDQREYKQQKDKARRQEKTYDVFADDFMDRSSPFGVSKPEINVLVGHGRKNPNLVKHTGNRKKKMNKHDV
ncbi:hypothetical protein SARC_00894 [Sphaeroforma arctica JP610]|uniref:20S-pre-rRNA D-site endonuclease NOB1 n=1 Tax=Sphaeroforma arctica JP610 TaxID=667725 RepID=A0A0L0GF66_9EUKA|nr:hypothetical protein SARC_00894 [Sphaeroforma arctica JP610]KNC86943.1 hypothetical protein SARC_00894 [Sphaeroforma arctica JP610]|eukprot:XP_014160845.1 hypothetical protein SARC_00894 [Sphaeroforma arctica JP610]